MIQIDFKECCLNCDHIEIDIQSDRAHYEAYRKPYFRIICSHQCVCKEYRESPDSEKVVKN